MPLLDNMATKESEKVMNLKRTSLEMAKIDKSGIVSFFKEIETAGIEIHDLERRSIVFLSVISSYNERAISLRWTLLPAKIP